MEGGCGWLQCTSTKSDEFNQNFTSFILRNDTGSKAKDFVVYSTSNLSLTVENAKGKKKALPGFDMGDLKVYFANSRDLKTISEFGSSRATTGECISLEFESQVLKEYHPSGLTCEVAKDSQCGEFHLSVHSNDLNVMSLTPAIIRGEPASSSSCDNWHLCWCRCGSQWRLLYNLYHRSAVLSKKEAKQRVRGRQTAKIRAKQLGKR